MKRPLVEIVHVRLDAEQFKRLAKAATAANQTNSEYMRTLLEDATKEHHGRNRNNSAT